MALPKALALANCRDLLKMIQVSNAGFRFGSG
jgi:hypothetical protein